MSGRVASVAVVAVGDELLAGAHPDLNSPEIARRLAPLGLQVREVCVVGDGEEEIAEAVRRGREVADLVIVTGGLGPTLDDVTRHGIARALGRKLEENAEAIAGLERWAQARGIPLAEANRRQALFPVGAERIPNRVGTAPGFWATDGGVGDRRSRDVPVVSLPGPPSEMGVVLREEIEPRLLERGFARVAHGERRFHLFGLSESVFADRVGDWMDRGASPRMGCSVKRGVLSVVLRAVGKDAASAESALASRSEAFLDRFGEHVFSQGDGRLEHVFGRRLIDEGVRVALAESCTGGLAASMLTSVPGISAVLERAWVTYADRAKEEELGVDAELLREHGAVSSQVAGAMALGAAQRAGARLGISTTGVAGPDGGSAEKPVGLVWLGTSLDGQVRTRELRLAAMGRDWIRSLAARHALFDGLRRLEEID